MPTDPSSLTLALVLTAGGATASAAVITGLIAMLKNLSAGSFTLGTWIDAKHEPTVAFLLSAALVAVAYVAVGDYTVTTGFGAFLAWFGIAQIAMGVHDTQAALAAPKAP